MRKHLRAAAMMVGVMSSGGVWASEDDEQPGQKAPAELPAPVAARIESSFPGARLAETSRWGNGWEASIVDGLRRQDLLLDAFGNVVERHVPIAVRELPEPVRLTLERTHPRQTVWRATRIETDGGVFHEVLLSRGDKRTAVVLDPDARVLADLRA